MSADRNLGGRALIVDLSKDASIDNFDTYTKRLN
jgi:hypothetical protein